MAASMSRPATSAPDNLTRPTTDRRSTHPSSLSVPLTTTRPTSLTLRQLCDAPLHLSLPPPPPPQSQFTPDRTQTHHQKQQSEKDGWKWSNVPLLSLFFWRHASPQCHDGRQGNGEHSHAQTSDGANDSNSTSNTHSLRQPSYPILDNQAGMPAVLSWTVLQSGETPPAGPQTSTLDTITSPVMASTEAIEYSSTELSDNTAMPADDAGSESTVSLRTLNDYNSTGSIDSSGVRVEVDARVWRDVSWSQLRRRTSHPDLFLSGVQCAVRLRASSGSGCRGEADIPGLHATYHVDHVWLITTDCKMYRSPLSRSSQGVMESDEGPDWDPGDCVDVVVRVMSTATKQVYLVRATDVSISVEVVFCHRMELLWSLAILWWGLLAQPAITLLTTIKTQGLEHIREQRRSWVLGFQAIQQHVQSLAAVARQFVAGRAGRLQRREHHHAHED